ncbi:outer membrane protein assembly factor BamB [Psychrobacter glacincola]|uniref:Outer membrane protein assembly factor BamB n=1 Tax=Psychrobacter immobilis TaxID=498 RepID=A0A2V1ZNU2_PSYIM|nr:MULTISPECIES: outer membrane protein assembly factor BamB [Psychrobacter]MDN5560375.1 outer membrane protein assembly factor BamB [Psychrobacter sp.]KRG34076.1 pyrrolo-quinoline quinone [Psychrobacter sp. P11F6]MCG3809283.1 outer membrane protein assembly factor BamB [Psychrobacter sp. Ps4]PWK10147.1 Beta-barrel assembly machine subunit BamB [Psychrobacter immobilis]GAF60517.1 outer membrane protein YfgL [Psychrobacter sp. JCM 18903]
MTQSIRSSKISKAKTIKSTVMHVAVLAVMSTAVIGCNRGIKPVVNDPVKLVQIAEPISVLQPVFSTDIGNKKASKKDPLDLQVGYVNGQIVTASRGGDLTGFNSAGERLWSINVGDQITGGVALDALSQTAIISTRGGQVMAFDSVTGAKRWQKQLSGSVLTPALITNNRVILSANDGFLHGLSLQTGQSVWQFATQVPAISVRGSAAPTLLDSKTALLATADGRLHAVTTDSGLPQWSRRVGVGTGSSEVERMSDVDGTPIVDKNQLFAISYSGQLLGIDLASRQVMFVNELASLKSLAVNNQQVIGTSLEGKVVAYNRSNGEVLWESEELAYRHLTNPVMIGNYIAVGDFDGMVHLFDPASGKIVSRVQTKGALSSLQVQGSRLMTQSTSGQVAIWQLAR